jgi:rsbT co-antagonist protein RsbR
VSDLSVEMLTRMLERMPGVAFCSRMDPATRRSRWLYIDEEKAAALYDVDPAAVRADPFALLERMVPEDVARVQAQIADSVQKGAPYVSVSRIRRRSGEIRWTETHATVEPDADGSVLWYGLMRDVTDRKELERSLAESEAAKAKSEALYQQVIDALPVGVMVTNRALEFEIWNPVMQRLSGGVNRQHGGDVTGAHGIFMADGVTPLPMERSGTRRALDGETLEEEVVVRNPRLEGEVRMHVDFTPLRDAEGKVYAALGTSQDITLQRRLETELRARNEQLAESEAAKAALIERLRRSIDELSNPILEVWDDVLVMPIIGVVDSRRTADMAQRLLGEVSRAQASFVIIDLTGVELVDTRTADHLMRLMRKVEIVGARCVLTGIRPAVADTLVDIGVEFGRLATLRNLKHGLREALRHARQDREAVRDLVLPEEAAPRPSGPAR